MWSGELSLVQELPVDGSRTADGQGVNVVYRHTRAHTHTHTHIYTYIHTVCFSRFSRWLKTSDKLSARTSTTAGAASGTVGGASSGGTSQRHHHHRKHRSRSTPRYADVEKPKKKKILSGGSTSLVSIPNAIKLSMLNSGLMSLGKWQIMSAVRFSSSMTIWNDLFWGWLSPCNKVIIWEADSRVVRENIPSL